MTPWHSCRLYTPGAATPATVATVVRGAVRGVSAGRVALLRGWAEGDRRKVVRVVADGADVAPSDIEWTGMPGGAPERRAGRPTTGRERQVVVRLSDAEEAACVAAAGDRSVAAWMREVAMAAAMG